MPPTASGRTCTAPTISSLSVALVVLSIIFALIADVYGVSLLFVFFKQSGAIFTNREELDIIKTMTDDELKVRKRRTLTTIPFAPIILVLGLIQNEFMMKSLAGQIVVAVIMGAVAISWWTSSIAKYYYVIHARILPGRVVDLWYFCSLMAVVFFSLFNVFLSFAWVTLGLLLDPSRVGAYFVAFLTIFTVVIFKIQSLAQLLKQAEAKLHLQIYKIYTGKKDDEIKEEDFNTIETLKMDEPTIAAYLMEKGLPEEQAAFGAKRIASFRRFRVRFLIGNLLGTVIVLVCLIVFILLGVEAFRLNSGVVTSIGSVLEGASGASAIVSDKVGDKQDQINDMVNRFGSGRLTKAESGRLSSIRISPGSEIELGMISPKQTD